MFLTDIIVGGVLAAFAVYAVLWSLNMRRVLGYTLGVEVIFTILLAWYHSGTFLGGMVATAGGMTLSILLRVTRWYLGCERLTKDGWRFYEH